MAIAHIDVGDTESINKINQAIDKANLVDDKADQSSLNTEVSARQAAIAAEAVARASAVSSEATSRAQADTAETMARTQADEVRPTFAQSVPTIRPGEAPRFFTAQTDGAPAAVVPFSDDTALTTSDGAVVQINGLGIVAPISVWRLEPGRQYRVRFILRRTIDTEDPANDAIRLAVRWLDKSKSGLLTTILADLVDVFVDSGRLEYSFSLSTVNADDINAVSPSGAIYVRPFVKAFGSGTTNVEVIEVTDITNSLNWSPDVSAYSRQLAAFSYQVDTVESQLDDLLAAVNADRTPTYAKVSTDDNFTLQVGANAEQIRHSGTLSADRTITLSAASAVSGSKFRITRTGPGSFNLSVGGLKNLTTNTWADVIFDGVAWYLAAYGAL